MAEIDGLPSGWPAPCQRSDFNFHQQSPPFPHQSTRRIIARHRSNADSRNDSFEWPKRIVGSQEMSTQCIEDVLLTAETRRHPEFSPVEGEGVDSPCEPAAALDSNCDSKAMTPDEIRQLSKCEDVLNRGLNGFFEMGSALLTIREGKLYRLTHPTFEDYCQKRWGIGRSYAWRMIGAAERMRLLPPREGVPMPKNEFQMRPFLRLAPEEFPGAWQKVVERANGSPIVQALVQEVVNSLGPQNPEGPVTPFRRQRRGYIPCVMPLGQVLILLHEIKQSIEKGHAERALTALNRIEDALFNDGSAPDCPVVVPLPV
jgi:hypothetical protein